MKKYKVVDGVMPWEEMERAAKDERLSEANRKMFLAYSNWPGDIPKKFKNGMPDLERFIKKDLGPDAIEYVYNETEEPPVIADPLCAFCKHLRSWTMGKCAAFPGGMPEEIRSMKKSHEKPWPKSKEFPNGDNGLQFEPRD